MLPGQPPVRADGRRARAAGRGSLRRGRFRAGSAIFGASRSLPPSRAHGTLPVRGGFRAIVGCRAPIGACVGPLGGTAVRERMEHCRNGRSGREPSPLPSRYPGRRATSPLPSRYPGREPSPGAVLRRPATSPLPMLRRGARYPPVGSSATLCPPNFVPRTSWARGHARCRVAAQPPLSMAAPTILRVDIWAVSSGAGSIASRAWIRGWALARPLRLPPGRAAGRCTCRPGAPAGRCPLLAQPRRRPPPAGARPRRPPRRRPPRPPPGRPTAWPAAPPRPCRRTPAAAPIAPLPPHPGRGPGRAPATTPRPPPGRPTAWPAARPQRRPAARPSLQRRFNLTWTDGREYLPRRRVGRRASADRGVSPNERADHSDERPGATGRRAHRRALRAICAQLRVVTRR